MQLIFEIIRPPVNSNNNMAILNIHISKLFYHVVSIQIWDKVFKDRPSEICGRDSLKDLKWYGLLKQTISLQIFYRLSSTKFTWSILEYFVPYIVVELASEQFC